MKTVVITTGQLHTDVDALACVLAYHQLYKLKNINSVAILPGPFTESITGSLKKLKLDYQTTLSGVADDYEYVLMDVSDPDHIANFVVINNVIEVYDHHLFGFDDFWRNKVGTKFAIEPVGACATLVWEKYVAEELSSKIDPQSADLLSAAIISNTLNFKASVTTARDTKAFQDLKEYIDFPEGWIERYFKEIEQAVWQKPKEAMNKDRRIDKFKDINYNIFQLEMWNAKDFVDENLASIFEVFDSYPNSRTFFTAPSISEGYNYLVTRDQEVKESLERLVDAHFDGEIGKTPKLYLRKEIIKLLKEET